MAEKEPKTKPEPNEALINLYGTDDIEKIYEGKESDRQDRVFAGKPNRVELTADECRKLCKKVGLDYVGGYETRVIEYTITDETADRYGDIVRAAGVDFKTNYFPNNPTVQYAHNYGMLPIGKTLKIWKEEKAVKAWALFYDGAVDNTGFSETVFKFVSTNAMPAVSIGFLPLESKRPKNKEEREKTGLGEYGTEFTKVDLLEYSPCSIGANPNALKNSIIDSSKRGIFGKGDVDHLQKIVPEDIFEDIKKELEAVEEPEEDTISANKVVESVIKEVLEEKLSPMIDKMAEFVTKMEQLKNTIEQLNITLEPKESPGAPAPSEQEKEIEDLYSIVDEDIKIGEGDN